VNFMKKKLRNDVYSIGRGVRIGTN
jgi:hypothetical protein